MAYQEIVKPLAVDRAITLYGWRAYLEIDFSGYADVPAFDKIKLEGATTFGGTYGHLETFSLTGGSGTIKNIITLKDKTVKYLRVKGYANDGSTEKASSTSVPVYLNVKVNRKDELKNGEDIAQEASHIADECLAVRASGKKWNIKDWHISEKSLGGHGGHYPLQFETLWSATIKEAYDEINSNDASDITEASITVGGQDAYLDQYPTFVKNAIEKRQNWVINAANMDKPHWIRENKLYTFKETGGDHGHNIAIKCADVLSVVLAKQFLIAKQEEFTAQQDEWSKLIAGKTVCDSLAAELIAKI